MSIDRIELEKIKNKSKYSDDDRPNINRSNLSKDPIKEEIDGGDILNNTHKSSKCLADSELINSNRKRYKEFPITLNKTMETRSIKNSEKGEVAFVDHLFNSLKLREKKLMDNIENIEYKVRILTNLITRSKILNSGNEKCLNNGSDNQDRKQIYFYRINLIKYKYRISYYKIKLDEILKKLETNNFNKLLKNSTNNKELKKRNKKYNYPILQISRENEDFDILTSENKNNDEKIISEKDNCVKNMRKTVLISQGNSYEFYNNFKNKKFSVFRFEKDIFVSCCDLFNDIMLIGTMGDKNNVKMFDFSIEDNDLFENKNEIANKIMPGDICIFNRDCTFIKRINLSKSEKNFICKVKMFENDEKLFCFILFKNGNLIKYLISKNFEFEEICRCGIEKISNFIYKDNMLLFTDGKNLFTNINCKDKKDTFKNIIKSNEFKHIILNVEIGIYKDSENPLNNIYKYFLILSNGIILSCDIELSKYTLVKYLKGAKDFFYEEKFLNGLIIDGYNGLDFSLNFNLCSYSMAKKSSPVYVKGFINGIINANRFYGGHLKENLICQLQLFNNIIKSNGICDLQENNSKNDKNTNFNGRDNCPDHSKYLNDIISDYNKNVDYVLLETDKNKCILNQECYIPFYQLNENELHVAYEDGFIFKFNLER